MAVALISHFDACVSATCFAILELTVGDHFIGLFSFYRQMYEYWSEVRVSQSSRGQQDKDKWLVFKTR